MDILHLSDNESFAVGIDVPVETFMQGLRKLEHCTILLVNKGTAKIEIDFCIYTLEERCLMGLLTNQFFRCLKVSRDFTVSYLTFTREIFFEATARFDPPFMAFLKQYPLAPSLSAEQAENNYQLMKIIYRLYREKEHSYRLPMFKNCLQNFLMDVYDKTKARFLHRNTKNTIRQEKLLEQFIALIFQYSDIHREVQFYANQMCITTRYLSSIVQNLTGYSPKVLIDNRCVQEIKMLLRTTNKSMQEIAFQLNFPDQSFFTRYFKKHTGMSPAVYREEKV